MGDLKDLYGQVNPNDIFGNLKESGQYQKYKYCCIQTVLEQRMFKKS